MSSPKLDFLSLITEGDESQNNHLFEGGCGQHRQERCRPTGEVVIPDDVTLPQGSALNQAINLAGNVEFIRFTREGEVDQRV